jgi:CDGSH-type Zn-finger protein
MSEDAAIERPKVVVSKNGPYLITGPVDVFYEVIATDDEDSSWTWKTGVNVPVTKKFAFCRCGQSSNKPFCDGSHRTHGFDASETAATSTYEEQAKLTDGPSMQLGDAEALCAASRFCKGHGDVWNLVTETSDHQSRELTAHEATHCPGGRLVAYDKESMGAALEPDLPASIGIIEDPARGISGGLWLRGGIPVTTADGVEYPVRNRQVLCRCGNSSNKPFCDGSHASVGFVDDMLAEVDSTPNGFDSVATPEV